MYSINLKVWANKMLTVYDKHLKVFALMAALLISNKFIEASAQLISIPPPPPSDAKIANEGKNVETSHFPSARQPPNVEVLTKDLREGKNVIKVRITSDAGIDYCKIKYTKLSGMKTVDCVNEQNNIYKALIDANAPSQTIEVYVSDIYGDSTNSVKKLNVITQPSIVDLLWNNLLYLAHTLR
jgi:hypothetical protein